jgi:uncharacterized FlgJ-related protein
MKTLIGGAILFLFWISPLRKSNAETPAKSANMADSVFQLMLKHDVKFAHIVKKQSYLETGNYTSPVFKQGYNCFGMRYNKRGVAIKKHLNHAAYRTVEDSVIDLKLWQEQRIAAYERKFGRITSDDKYYHFLNHIVIGNGIYRYAEDVKYTDKLKRLNI